MSKITSVNLVEKVLISGTTVHIKDPLSEPERCYNRNFDCFPHDSQTLPQQYFCCENCGGPHETYQCQPMNQEYYSSYSSGFDQFQPPQFSDVYQTPPVQETLNQIQKDQEEKSIVELLAEERIQKANQVLNESQSPQEMRIQDLEIQKQQCLEEMKEWMNDLGIREYRKEGE
ncbi:hypothetical protein Tco_1314360 [Tanacetum coccineum]